MSKFFFTLNEHVIYIYFHVPSDLLAEHFIHLPLVGYSYIFQSKGHYLIVIEPLAHNERSFLLILLYPENASMNVSSLCLAVESTS